MSAYEELVERCAKQVGESIFGYVDPVATPNTWGQSFDVSRIALAEVLRTLETVTPEMAEAAGVMINGHFSEAYLVMLRASPLAPPAGAL